MSVPEKIWAWFFRKEEQVDVMQGGWTDKFDRREQEYTRSDLIPALVAAAEERGRIAGRRGLHQRNAGIAGHGGRVMGRIKTSLAVYGFLAWPCFMTFVVYAMQGWERDVVSKSAFLTCLMALPVFLAFDLLWWAGRAITRFVANRKDAPHD